MKPIVAALVSIALPACAHVDEETREYNRLADQENWRMCQAAYDQANVPTYHAGHSHSKGIKKNHAVVRQDLAMNDCKKILRGYWIDRQ